jgi:hypothetical protein
VVGLLAVLDPDPGVGVAEIDVGVAGGVPEGAPVSASFLAWQAASNKDIKINTGAKRLNNENNLPNPDRIPRITRI